MHDDHREFAATVGGSIDAVAQAFDAAFELLLGGAALVLASANLDEKRLAGAIVRAGARCMTVLAQRAADLGIEEQDGPLRPSACTPKTAAAAAAQVAAGVERLRRARFVPPHAPPVSDADTAHALAGCAALAAAAHDAIGTDRRWSLVAWAGRPARPAGLRIVEDASVVLRGAPSLAARLHWTMFSIELCAAEVCASSILHDARHLPVGFSADMAKQVEDELRHFDALEHLLRREGSSIGAFPVDTVMWDRHLLARTAVERLLVEQRIGEGFGLDGGLAVEDELRAAGDTEGAEVFAYINVDEMTHVRNGNRWLGHLLDNDRQRLLDVERDVIARLEQEGHRVSHGDPVNVEARLQAGFWPDDLDRLGALVRPGTDSGAGRR